MWAEMKRKRSVEVEGGEDMIRGPLSRLGFGEGQGGSLTLPPNWLQVSLGFG